MRKFLEDWIGSAVLLLLLYLLMQCMTGISDLFLPRWVAVLLGPVMIGGVRAVTFRLRWK